MGNPNQLRFNTPQEPTSRHFGHTVVHAPLPDEYDQGYVNGIEFRGQQDSVNADATPPYTENGVPTVLGPEGSYVNIADRAKHLGVALNSLGRRNQRLGFRDAAEIQPSRTEIWGRYARNTEKVLAGANKNEAEFLKKAKREFWQATGISALHGAGIVDQHTHDALGRSMWRDFSSKYGIPGAEVTKKRDKAKRLYKRQQKKFADADTQAAA